MEHTEPEATHDGEGRKNLRRHAIEGTVWVVFGFGAGQVLRLVSSVILTRFLHPEVYGLIDLVTVVIIGLALFSDVGIGPSVVQSPRGEDQSFLDTAWTMKVVRGVILFAAAIALSWPLARVYERPVLQSLLCVIALTVLLDGLGASGILLLIRRVQRKVIVLFELIRDLLVFLGTIFGVFLINPTGFKEVWVGANPVFNESFVWAVVIGTLAGNVAYFVLGYAALPSRWSRLAWDKAAAKEIFSFGSWIFLSTILTFLVTQTDRLIVPKVADFGAAGLYGRAVGLAAIPIGIAAKVSDAVVFPMCSRLKESAGTGRRQLCEIYLSVGMLNSMMVSGLVACAPAATRMLYPAAYGDVGWLAQLLAVGAWMRAQSSVIGCALMGFNQRTSMVVPNLVKLAAMAILIWPSVRFSVYQGWGEVVGIVVGFSLAEFAFFLAMKAYGRRIRFHTTRIDLLLGFLIVGAALGAQYCADFLFRNAGALGTGEGRLRWAAVVAVRGVIVVALWGGVGSVLYRLGWVRIR